MKASKYPFYIVISDDNKLAKIEFLRTALPRIIELLLIGFFFVTILYFFRKRIVKPITDLYQAAKEIAHDHNITKIDKSEYREINLLAEQLEEISEIKNQLTIAKNLEKQANELLEQKVQERTIELEKAIKVKTEFLNNLSHEVRTPIQGVTAISSGLIEHWDAFNEEKRHELAKQIYNNSQRLFSLVNDILDLSRFTTGQVTLHKEKIDLAELILEVIEECKPLYENKADIKIIFAPPNFNTYVGGDWIKLCQVIRNLLSNAIKFTLQGNIIISIDKITDYIQVTIIDQGIGVPDFELKDIFMSFKQSSRTDKKSGGTGLGLAICRGIIEAHSGSIWAENNQDSGTSFKFILPEYVEQSLQRGSSSDQKKNVVIIDDEKACLMSMEMILHNSNYQLITINSAREGLEYIKSHANEIDAVLLDIMMPEMNGFEVLDEIRKDINARSIPVILQSGAYSDDNFLKQTPHKVDGFMMKPYKKETVFTVLGKVVYS
jgi:two-component system sensor histidine kinase ChiS